MVGRSVIELKGGRAEFDNILAAAKREGKLLVLIDYWMKGCPPCVELAPRFKALAQSPKYREKVVFVKCNNDKNEEFVDEEGIEGFPWLHLYSAATGEMLDDDVTFVEDQYIVLALDEHCAAEEEKKLAQ